jgi:formylmethanofuran dehydrogenase subunit E
MENTNEVQNTTNVGNEVLADVMCSVCGKAVEKTAMDKQVDNDSFLCEKCLFDDELIMGELVMY